MTQPLKLSEARSKMTRLDKILKPGEVLHITRRGKAYARLELIAETNRYDEVLKSIEALPEPKGKKQAVAQSYKSFLYEKDATKK
ncbi:MAG: hypothetical protein HY787_24110 [Deltaproteobacteria bacterium]|nr:hypothetical protein [Deltaproteobacteria bacterium]